MKTKLKATAKLFCLLIALIIINGCTKEKDTIIGDSNDGQIASFKSTEEYNDYRKVVFSLSFAELRVYEESKGYKSFGRACDELYLSIDPNKFKNTDEVIKFVEEHSKYLQLISQPGGEFILETVNYDDPYRYFYNEEGIYQIGSNVIKKLQGYLVSTDRNNLNNLKTIDNNNIEQYLDDTDFIVSEISKNEREVVRLKDEAYNCGTEDDKQEDNGNERIHMEIDIYMTDMWDYVFEQPIGTLVHAHYLVRPYHRVLFIWYWCTRYIKADIKVANDYFVFPTWFRTTGTFYNSGEDNSKFEGDLGNDYASWPGYTPHYYHFGGYDCWATQENVTDSSKLERNTELF